MENSERTHAPLGETAGGAPPTAVPLPTPTHTPLLGRGGPRIPGPHPPPKQRPGPARRTPVGRGSRVRALGHSLPPNPALLGRGARGSGPQPQPCHRRARGEAARPRRGVSAPSSTPHAPIAAFSIPSAPQGGSSPPPPSPEAEPTRTSQGAGVCRCRLPGSPETRAPGMYRCAVRRVGSAQHPGNAPMSAPALVSLRLGLPGLEPPDTPLPGPACAPPPAPLRADVTAPPQPMAVGNLSPAGWPPRFKPESRRLSELQMGWPGRGGRLVPGCWGLEAPPPRCAPAGPPNPGPPEPGAPVAPGVGEAARGPPETARVWSREQTPPPPCRTQYLPEMGPQGDGWRPQGGRSHPRLTG